MNTILLMVMVFVLYVLAYNSYGRFLGKKIFKLSSQNLCPSESMKDGVDFVPTKKFILFGHHFTSIAGTGPVVGPAIGIIWGWVPALLWVLLGSIFMGGIHDFGSMVISLRNSGRSIGDLAGNYIGKRAQLMFMAIVFLLLWIVIAIFGLIIAIVFEIFPQSVIPVFAQIPIAIWLGYQFYHKKSNYLLTTVVALVLLYIMVIIGAEYPIRLQPFWGISPVIQWTIVLMVYVYIASTLPVQVLLQPRDFINAYQLILTMVLMALGIIFSNPEMVAPAVNLHPEGAPNLMPMLFVIIACGAISGFHSVVSSGTSSKQCDREPNALFVGYGSMLTEGMLAVFVLIACGAGIGLGLKQGNTTLFGVDAFNQYYASWQAVEGLGSKINALVTGSSNMISKLGIPGKIVITLMGVFISTFAATTLDTATRLQRYIVAESAANLGNKFFQKKHPATAFAVISAMLLAFSNGSGNGAMRLWPLFGSLNQLLAGLALLVITVYLKRKNVNMFYSLLPMIFMILMTGWAMGINLVGFYNLSDWLLFSIGLIVVFFEVWILIESAILLFHRKDISDNR